MIAIIMLCDIYTEHILSLGHRTCTELRKLSITRTRVFWEWVGAGKISSHAELGPAFDCSFAPSFCFVFLYREIVCRMEYLGASLDSSGLLILREHYIACPSQF